MSDDEIWERRRSSFGTAAVSYATGRPSYPREALQWGAPPGATTALDLAAGTGILTAGLLELGLDVTSVEPLAEMRALIPGPAEAIDGTAEAIPLPDACVDAVFVGQAWHWFDIPQAVEEAHRVLRPAGNLVVTWNLIDTADELSRTIADIIDAEERSDQLEDDDAAEPPYDDPLRFTAPERLVVHHQQRYDADRIVAYALSRSQAILLAPDDRQALVDQLLAAVPADGFAVSFVCETWRATAL